VILVTTWFRTIDYQLLSCEMSTRVYIGNLPSRASERDIEDFFRKFGRLREVVVKNGFGFAEFEDARDADDAIYEMNGRELQGSRVVVEACRRKPEYRGGGGRDFRRDDYRGGDRRGSYRDGPRKSTRYGPPVQTRYRMAVENLSTRCSWQDLKDLMRQAGEVTFADAHKKERNKAVICFERHEDLKRAIEKYQGKDINGRKIKLIDETRSVSRSRSRSRSAHRSRSRSRSNSRSRSPIAANGRSASRSPN